MFFRAHFASNLYAFCIHFACFFDSFPEQSNTGNRKNECILTHLDTSRVGVSFLVIARPECMFFRAHFAVILDAFLRDFA